MNEDGSALGEARPRGISCLTLAANPGQQRVLWEQPDGPRSLPFPPEVISGHPGLLTRFSLI